MSIRFEELVNCTIKRIEAIPGKEKQWQACIKEAKDLLAESVVNRMVIAEIAERACFIFWGGDVKSEEFNKRHKPHTLKKFAELIGVNYHTLTRWARTKRRVFDFVSDETKSHFNYTAAETVADGLLKKPMSAKEIQKAYEKQANRSYSDKRREKIYKYLRESCYQICDRNLLKSCSEDEVADIRLWVRRMSNTLNRF